MVPGLARRHIQLERKAMSAQAVIADGRQVGARPLNIGHLKAPLRHPQRLFVKVRAGFS